VSTDVSTKFLGPQQQKQQDPLIDAIQLSMDQAIAMNYPRLDQPACPIDDPGMSR